MHQKFEKKLLAQPKELTFPVPFLLALPRSHGVAAQSFPTWLPSLIKKL